MRIILDISTTADNRIEGTASWLDDDGPRHFSGWLALMRLFEDAQLSHGDGAESRPVRTALADSTLGLAAETGPDP